MRSNGTAVTLLFMDKIVIWEIFFVCLFFVIRTEAWSSSYAVFAVLLEMPCVMISDKREQSKSLWTDSPILLIH